MVKARRHQSGDIYVWDQSQIDSNGDEPWPFNGDLLQLFAQTVVGDFEQQNNSNEFLTAAKMGALQRGYFNGDDMVVNDGFVIPNWWYHRI